MFIGHAPASYLMTSALRRRAWALDHPGWIWLGVAAGLFPDLDLIYFYTLDHRRHLHHSYVTHLPFDWLLVTIAAALAAASCARVRRLAVVFLVNVWLHLALDSVVGRIEWLYPWSERGYALFDVPARFGRQFHVLNYVLHWTFLFEIALVAAAFWFIRASSARVVRAV
jgi:inner membrane protein